MPQQSIRFGGCRFGEVYAFYIFLRPDMTNKVDWALKANYLLTYFFHGESQLQRSGTT